MNIATKLNLRDTVFFIHENKVVQAKVDAIKVCCTQKQWGDSLDRTDIYYKVTWRDDTNRTVELEVFERNAFPTKEALKESL